jgi:Zn-dependent peptidase ImmA (M78 family)
MATILDHIRSLECYVERSGVRLVRSPLPDWVDGRVFSNLIMLRADLNPEQELQTLVHELTHWLTHRDPCLQQPCAVFEYEAEAVEALVMARLGLQSRSDQIDAAGDDPTDGLLSASVKRVVWASGRICDALGV